MPTRRAAIAGIHEYPQRRVDGLSKMQIKAASAARALADAGLTFSDVDALYDAGETGPMSAMTVAEHLRITPWSTRPQWAGAPTSSTRRTRPATSPPGARTSRS